ncbi:hypothetical protein K435DRAFT_785015 [Dendrothele bispora CBS 962.96]|uniref:Uncharacterized protein n=1 Tax=Dendrothele bispora (strain CBS 962.96) TaxID=1314807 RepID=A0A4S8L0G8_DENBC|nr:hypothetical protein K435DRAFT_785015 [Dendrothele bispora CBS 962.96]
MDKFLVSSVHPASAKRQLANHLQVPKPQILFFTYPVIQDVLCLVTPITTRYEELVLLAYTLFKVAQSQILS